MMGAAAAVAAAAIARDPFAANAALDSARAVALAAGLMARVPPTTIRMAALPRPATSQSRCS